MEDWPLGQVADFGANAQPGAQNAHVAQMEILRRQTVFYERSAEASERAERAAQATEAGSRAATKSAEAASASLRYMRLSIWILGGAALLSVLVQAIAIFAHG